MTCISAADEPAVSNCRTQWPQQDIKIATSRSANDAAHGSGIAPRTSRAWWPQTAAGSGSAVQANCDIIVCRRCVMDGVGRPLWKALRVTLIWYWKTCRLVTRVSWETVNLLSVSWIFNVTPEKNTWRGCLQFLVAPNIIMVFRPRIVREARHVTSKRRW